MDFILIFLAGIGAAILSNRLDRRGSIGLADFASGAIGGLVGLSMAQILSAEGAGRSLGLPLLIAICLTLGLESLRAHPSRR